MIKKHIPNFITCLNLFAGSIAVYYGFLGNYQAVFGLVLLAALFDFLDGFAARALHAYSPMGKELDSLADMVSFGLAPGVVAFSLLSQSSLPSWLAFAGFIIPVFSALRLAKFNIDERQTTSFIGMPTPANAIFWIGIGYSFPELMITNSWLILALIIIMSGLLVAEIPMFSLKFKSFKWQDSRIQYIFLIQCVIMIAGFKLGAFPLIIVLYILNSLANLFFSKK
jgi:CDP-diacylglycerol---serine O-phosphatidyltransferase